MNTRSPLLQIVVLLGVIVAAGGWIWRQQREDARMDGRAHDGLGEVLAEQTAAQLAKREKKRVVAVSLQGGDAVLQAQEAAFLRRLKEVCPEAEMKEFYRVSPEADKRYGPGVGLSARRFIRMVENNVKADVIVSFIGAPDPGANEFRGFTNKIPRFIASTRDLNDVRKLLEKRWLRAAIVPRYQFPAPAGDPRTSRGWFDRQFQVVTTNELATLPGEPSHP